jgi:hypothetical protein
LSKSFVKELTTITLGYSMAEEKKEEEKIRKMAEFRAVLEKRVKELEVELEGLKAMLEFANDTLLKKGFKKAEVVMPPSALPEAPKTVKKEYEETVPLNTADGEFLANLYVGKDSLRVVLAEDKNFNVNTPPFMPFLIERVLAKMQERDRESVRTGEATPGKMISYNIMREGDIIRELTIRNVEPERIRELKSSIRWTLEKIYEKMTQTK